MITLNWDEFINTDGCLTKCRVMATMMMMMMCLCLILRSVLLFIWIVGVWMGWCCFSCTVFKMTFGVGRMLTDSLQVFGVCRWEFVNMSGVYCCPSFTISIWVWLAPF